MLLGAWTELVISTYGAVEVIGPGGSFYRGPGANSFRADTRPCHGTRGGDASLGRGALSRHSRL